MHTVSVSGTTYRVYFDESNRPWVPLEDLGIDWDPGVVINEPGVGCIAGQSVRDAVSGVSGEPEITLKALDTGEFGELRSLAQFLLDAAVDVGNYSVDELAFRVT